MPVTLADDILLRPNLRPERDVLTGPVRFVFRIIQPDQAMVNGVLDNPETN